MQKGEKDVEICCSTYCWLNLYVTQFNAGNVRSKIGVIERDTDLVRTTCARQKVDKCASRNLDLLNILKALLDLTEGMNNLLEF